MAITIDRIDTWIIEVPTIRPHVLSMTSINKQVMTLVFVSCSDGITGVGEGTTIGGLSYGNESPEGIKLAIDLYCAPILIGQRAEVPASAMSLLRNQVVGNHFAKNALECALLDAAGQRSGLAMSELLGGRLRQKLPVLWVLASGDTAQDIDEATQMIESGRHNVFKLKIGKRPLKDDVAHVAKIKRALGDRASIRVDVNQAWNQHTATRGTKMLADAGVDLIEQPVHRADRAGLEQLTRYSPVPIMADETLNGPGDALEVARRNGAHAFSIKPAQAGGLFAAGQIAAIGTAGNIGIYGGTMLEGGVGTIASAQLFSTFENLDWGTELFAPLLQTENILATPLVYRDFSLEVPNAPGLGIKLDMDKVKHFRRNAPAKTVSSSINRRTV
ncbi:muconate cycloisomerase family protein [Hyphococcus sp. DH-69]|uniref:muconate cycloisomerase family protein n=1 Tax=Hyphococcus formosus TaxID=3143534 RepID=UPI00398AF47D